MNKHSDKKIFDFSQLEALFTGARVNATLLEQASFNLGRLHGLIVGGGIPTSFLSLVRYIESWHNNQIEGSRLSFEEFLTKQSRLNHQVVHEWDWEDVEHAARALELSADITVNNLLGVHHELLAGSNNWNKQPGKIRDGVVWIGGASPESAKFVPPAPALLPSYLEEWERFWKKPNEEQSILIKIAISHYHFESIHPFFDGNGRVGRAITLFQLTEKELIPAPALLLSGEIFRHRQLYYCMLDETRTAKNFDAWCAYYIEAVSVAAQKTCLLLESLANLQKSNKEKISKEVISRRSAAGIMLLDELVNRPLVRVKDVEDYLRISHQTAYSLVEELERVGVLQETTFMKKNKIYQYTALKNLISQI